MSRRATSSQHPSERLVGLVQIRQHRMKTKPGAIVHRRAFLLGMRVDQRRVDIDHDPLRPHPQAPRPIPRRRTRGAQRIKQCRLARDPIDQPKRRRIRSDRTEQRLLIPDRPKIRQAIAAVGEHHREIPNTRPGSCRPRRSRTPTSAAERSRVSPTRSATSPSNAAPACETKPSPSAATSTVKLRPSRCTFKVNLPSRSCGRRTPTESPLRRTVPRPRPSGPQLLHERSGLRTPPPSTGNPWKFRSVGSRGYANSAASRANGWRT